MMRKLLVLLLLLLSMQALSYSQSCEERLPEWAKQYLVNHEAGWRLLHLQDFAPYHRDLWRQYHGKLCPGLAEGDFLGDRSAGLAVALVRMQKDGKSQEKLLFLRQQDEGVEAKVLEAPAPATKEPFMVVWMAPAGVFRDFYDQRKKVRVGHDVILWEYMESSVLTFYYDGGRWHHILTSD